MNAWVWRKFVICTPLTLYIKLFLYCTANCKQETKTYKNTIKWLDKHSFIGGSSKQGKNT